MEPDLLGPGPFRATEIMGSGSFLGQLHKIGLRYVRFGTWPAGSGSFPDNRNIGARVLSGATS